LVLLDLTVRPEAAVGAVPINLRADVRDAQTWSLTNLADGAAEGLFLSPAPTNAATDAVDGQITVYVPGWHNIGSPYDVNGDGVATPADALAVVNYLNSQPGDIGLPSALVTPDDYYDVNNDQLCTPLDVLAVINHLNAQALLGAEGEQSGFASTPLTASRFAEGSHWAALTSDVVSPGSAEASARAESSSGTVWQAESPTAWPRTPLAAGIQLRPAAAGEPSTDNLEDRLFAELETEVSSLEGVLTDLADDIASAWR
jgi:hypothetical protein